jgi:hypothetical protein
MASSEMAMRRFIALLAISVGAFVLPANSAGRMTAGELYSFCTSSARIVKNACGKFILGAVQGISLADEKADDKKMFCVPDDVDESHLVAIFVSAMGINFTAYPQDRNLSAVSMVGAAMMQAFPCQNENRNSTHKDA